MERFCLCLGVAIGLGVAENMVRDSLELLPQSSGAEFMVKSAQYTHTNTQP